MGADLYCCRGLKVTPLDSGRVLVTTLADRERVIVQTGVATLAMSCREFATLDAHAATNGGGDEVKRLLQRLVDGGLLVSKQDFVEMIQVNAQAAVAPTLPTLSTIGIPTCNRAEAIARGLHSYLANATRHGREVRAIISDDTLEPANQQLCREALSALSRRHGRDIVYAGPDEKRAFIERLIAASRVDRSTLDFALFGSPGSGPTFGANRNALYLANVGTLFFSADDDTVATLLAPDDAEEGVGFSSDEDPTCVRIFRKGQPLGGKQQDVDLLAVHEKTLGRSTAEILPEALADLSFDRCRPNLMARLERGEGRVLVSWTGIAGDAGAGLAQYYLYHPHTDRTGIKTDDDYHAYCRSRLIFRAPKRLLLGDGKYCQTTALAFDATALLPPFVPNGRGEDIVFGQLLRIIRPESLTAYHPLAISHMRFETRVAPVSAEFMKFNTEQVTFYTLLLSCLQSFVPLPGAQNAGTLLVALGKHLGAFREMPPLEFILLMQDVQSRSTGDTLASLEHHLHASALLPLAYRKDLQAMIENTLSMVAQGSGLPDTFVKDRTLTEAAILTQERLKAYGDLCVAWPDIVAASQELRASGEGLGYSVRR